MSKFQKPNIDKFGPEKKPPTAPPYASEIGISKYFKDFTGDGAEEVDLAVPDYSYIKREYIKEGFHVEGYQKIIDDIVSSKLPINEKIAKLANYMVSDFPKLPYFWGGGHGLTKEQLTGIDETWGKMAPIVYGGDDEYPIGKMFPNSLDCTGFVSWCFINCGVDLSPYLTYPESDYCLSDYSKMSDQESVQITDENVFDVVKVGDVAYMPGHVGIVTDVNPDAKTISVAHVSGSGHGANLTTMSTETGLIVKDQVGPLPDGVSVDRVGKPYFTEIIPIHFNQ